MGELRTVAVENTAQAYLELLAAMGLKYLIGTAGSDFPSIIDGLAKRAIEGHKIPKPLLVAHEGCGVAMAHGYYLATGQPAMVMVHTTPGTANAVGPLTNAANVNIPMILAAGRTPIHEAGKPGSRDNIVQWAQEIYDQAGMVRQFVKWDYELRSFEQLEAVVRRAVTMAMTQPRGPVYLTLPREVLAEPHHQFTFSTRGWDSPVQEPAPDVRSVEKLAAMIAEAANPLVLTRNLGRNPDAVPRLVELAEAFALPIVEYPMPGYMNFPASHPMHLGYGLDGLLDAADLVIVADSDVPWYPAKERAPAGAKVVHLGIDPIHSRYPIWGFRNDLAIAAEPALILGMLNEVLAPMRAKRSAAIGARAARLKAQHDKQRENRKAEAAMLGKAESLSAGWVSHCLGEVKDENMVFINEYDLIPRHLAAERAGSFFGVPPAGHLGWGLGAALGFKLGAPEKTVVTVVGDGAYLFNAPSACHLASAAHALPTLTIIVDNGGWAAVKTHTYDLHPEGWAERSGNPAFVRFEIKPRYESIVEAFGGHGITVSDPREFRGVLERALRVVRDERRQVVIDARCAPV